MQQTHNMERETTVKKYDFLIVGAGIFGATCARLLADKGYKCLIIERKGYVGGLCSDFEKNGVNVTRFGPHVFYTDNDEVWDFVNKYSKFNDYIHFETMLKDDKLFRVPIDMLTMNQIFGQTTSPLAFKSISNEVKNYNVSKATTLEDECILQSGLSIYGALLRTFYEKKFGRKCSELAPRMPFTLPISVKHETKMYDVKHQGYPVNGYTKMVENMIGDDIDIMLNKDFVKNIEKYSSLANIVIYTGAIDELCHYSFGPLAWHTAKFEQSDESMRGNYIYGVAVTNVADPNNELERIIEHKWFTPERKGDPNYEKTNIVTYEYTKRWEPGDENLYSLLSNESIELWEKYNDFAAQNFPNIVLCGKTASYDNFTMAESIEAAMAICENIISKDEIEKQEN